MSELFILIVDDEKIQRQTISYLFKKDSNNIHIIQGTNGKEAVKQIINNKNIKIIIMDITMPECDGIQATKMIRLMNKNVKIYAVTAADITPKIKKICLKAGMNGFYSKPFLTRYVKEILNN